MDTRMFDTMRVFFIRAHLERHERDTDTYEYALHRIYCDTLISIDGASNTLTDHTSRLRELIGHLIAMFMEDIAIPSLWIHSSQTFASLLTSKHNDNACELRLLRTELLLWRNALNWLPVIHALRLMNIAAPPTISPAELLLRGDYRAIMRAQIDDIAMISLADKYRALFADLEQWSMRIPTIAAHIAQFSAFLALRILDPRGSSDICGVCDANDVLLRPVRPECAFQQPLREADIESTFHALICQSSEQLNALSAPDHLMREILDNSRARVGELSFGEENLLNDLVANSPLVAEKSLSADLVSEIKVLLQLSRGNFIGFDGIHRNVLYGPTTCATARTCLNLDHIRAALHIPRDNNNARLIQCPGGSLFFAMNISMPIIPMRMKTVPQMIAATKGNTDIRRAFVLNCLWRFVMNLPGQGIASELLMDDSHQFIIGFNEYETRSSSSHRMPDLVIQAIHEDATFYREVFQGWIHTLRRIANIECIAHVKNPNRSRLTGITYASLSKCVARAIFATECWLHLKT